MGLHEPLRFGKYEGLSVAAIARFDPAYLLWIKRNLSDFKWSDEALAVAKRAWTRDHYEKSERQNGWAWGCGAAVKRAAEKARERAAKIEAEERRKVADAMALSDRDGGEA